MKRLVVLILSFFFCTWVYAQKEVKLEQIGQLAGDSVRICDKIFGSRMFPSKPGRPTWLYMGALYPNQKLKLVIWGKDQVHFSGSPDFDYIEQKVCVTGVINLVNGQPEMILYSDKQIIIQLEVEESDQ